MPPTPARDPQWLVDAVRRIQADAGDRESFRPIFDHYEPLFRRFLRRRRIPPDLADDLAQDAILRVYRGIAKFDWRSSFNTWTFRIVNNVYKKHLESLETHRGRARHESIDEGTSGSDTERRLEPLVDQRPSPFEETAFAARKAKLAAALDELPARMRQSILLRVQGFSYREIARMMGVTGETVKKQLAEARRRLRPMLDGVLSLIGALLGGLTSWMGG